MISQKSTLRFAPTLFGFAQQAGIWLTSLHSFAQTFSASLRTDGHNTCVLFEV